MNENTTIQTKPAALSRRRLLSTGAVAGAAAMLGPVSGAFAKHGVKRAASLTFADIPGTGDIQVLNFALALEDLEADLYAQALARLTGGGTNKLGVQFKGLGIPATQPDVRFVKEFGKVEVEHSEFVRAAVTAAGGPVLPVFKYNFGIENLNRKQVDDLLLQAEEIGVTAYLGAIPFFSSSNSPYIQPAAAILGTEARHAAVLATLYNVLFRESNNPAPLANQNDGRDTPVAPDKVLAKVSPFIVM